MSNHQINQEGAAFLKTATSSPDFENLSLEGIPDDFSGPTFVKKDFIYTTVTALPGQVAYFLMTPTAGTAYFAGTQALVPSTDPVNFKSQPIGTDQGGIFPDAPTLFPGCSTVEVEVANSGEVVEGRMISHSAELVCVNNAFNQYGTITTLKTPITRVLVEQSDFGKDVAYRLMGAQALVKPTLTSEADVTPVRDGSYAVAMSKEAQFTFAPVLDDISIATDFPCYLENKVDSTVGSFQGPAVIWDNGFDTIMFRVQVPLSTELSPVPPQVFILKVWRSWEFKPAASSLAHSIAHASPPHNANTIELYHEMSKNLPVSVPVRDNPDFWDDLVSTMSMGTGILADMNVPGAKGMHAVGSLVGNLVHKGSERRTARRGNRKKKKNKPKKKGKKRR